MKTQNSKLNFKTSSLVELNDNQMLKAEGGSTPACFVATANMSSAGCAGISAAFVAWLLE
ncbi:hypothetical protein [Pontimicrobium sp. MEBiC01747]